MNTLVCPGTTHELRLLRVVGVGFRDRASCDKGTEQIALYCALIRVSESWLTHVIPTLYGPYTFAFLGSPFLSILLIPLLCVLADVPPSRSLLVKTVKVGQIPCHSSVTALVSLSGHRRLCACQNLLGWSQLSVINEASVSNFCLLERLTSHISLLRASATVLKAMILPFALLTVRFASVVVCHCGNCLRIDL